MTNKVIVPDIGDFENVEIIEILVKPFISSPIFVGPINLISKDIVTQGELLLARWAAVPAPASIIEQM